MSNEVTAAEDGLRVRAQRVVSSDAAHGKGLTEKLAECSWGVIDGLTVVRSRETGFVFLVDPESGTFYRTWSTDTDTLKGGSPTEIIAQDRSWLFKLMPDLPGGRKCLARYVPGAKQPEATPPQGVSKATPPPKAAPVDFALVLEVQETRRITLVQSTKVIDLATYQVQGLLRKAGATVPDHAVVRTSPRGFAVEWAADVVTKDLPLWQSHSAQTFTLFMDQSQLVKLVRQVRQVPDKVQAAMTPTGYVRLSWIEESEEQEGEDQVGEQVAARVEVPAKPVVAVAQKATGAPT